MMATDRPANRMMMQDMARPTLSVFLSSYNHKRFLGDALDALLAQSFKPESIYVVDDASTDGSADLIAEYARRYPLIQPVLLSENRGLIENMNAWLNEADTDFVYFAASDDIVLPGLFEKSMALLAGRPDAGLCSARSILIDAEGRELGDMPAPRPMRGAGCLNPETARDTLMRLDSWFMGNTALYNRKALLEAGGFDPRLESFTDGFACRVLAVTYGACYVDEPLAAWRRMSSGYAESTLQDWSATQSVMRCALDLMGKRFKEVFPKGYAERWRRRWLYGFVMRQLDEGGREMCRRVGEALGYLSVPDRVVLQCVLHLPGRRIRRLGVEAFLALRWRPFDIVPTLVRQMRSAFGGVRN